MAATIVRLEENSYRQSWKEAEAALFLPLFGFSGGVKTLFSIPFYTVCNILPGGTSMLSSFFYDISRLHPFYVRVLKSFLPKNSSV